MPEIWLPYGDVEVVLSLKAEQLSQEVKVEDGEVDLDEVRERIESLEFDFSRGLTVLDEGPYSIQILDLTISTLGLKPSDIRLLAPAKTWRVLERRGFKRPSSGYSSLGIVDGCRITAPSEVERGTLVISEVGFDVLYGFKGPWSAVCDSLDLKGEVILDLGKYRPQSHLPNCQAYIGGAEWSPDAKKILYYVTVEDGHEVYDMDIYMINTDGTGNI